MSCRRVGVAVVGLGGAVATTAVAGVELLRLGQSGPEGLPLAGLPEAEAADLVNYDDLVFAGWDLNPVDLAKAAEEHQVLSPAQLAAAGDALSSLTPWPAAGSTAHCRNIDGDHRLDGGLRSGVAAIRADLARFAADRSLDGSVVVHLASTERLADPTAPALATLAGFERALDEDDPAVSPAMLYAYAALVEGIPYVNFTPSATVDLPALAELAVRGRVAVAGKDGKTGQTLLKTVLAPALRARALRVDGWYSTNLLGNRDGLALDHPDSLATKVGTKTSVLDDLLGYEVADHLVDIRYYRPRGDNKEAWDNIDLTGFLGQAMQLKVNFLCRDSVLAAPLVIELARLADLAARRGCVGPVPALGAFFKAPMPGPDGTVEHALHRQWDDLLSWLSA